MRLPGAGFRNLDSARANSSGVSARSSLTIKVYRRRDNRFYLARRDNAPGSLRLFCPAALSLFLTQVLDAFQKPFRRGLQSTLQKFRHFWHVDLISESSGDSLRLVPGEQPRFHLFHLGRMLRAQREIRHLHRIFAQVEQLGDIVRIIAVLVISLADHRLCAR